MFNTISMLENKNTLIMIWMQLIFLSLKRFYTENSFRTLTGFCCIKLRIFLTVYKTIELVRYWVYLRGSLRPIRTYMFKIRRVAIVTGNTIRLGVWLFSSSFVFQTFCFNFCRDVCYTFFFFLRHVHFPEGLIGFHISVGVNGKYTAFCTNNKISEYI